MSDLKASTLDEEAAACLTAARRALERGFAEGAAGIRDLPRTMEALKELQHTMEQEEWVEAAVALGKHMQHLQLLHEPAGRQQQGEGGTRVGGGGSGGGKRVCIMLDGSLNSCSALWWAVEHLVDPEDDLHLLTVIPFHSIPFESDADMILQEAYDFAHNAAGVKPARLHPRSIMAGGGMGSTGGVGEAAAEFVKQAAIDVVVLGSRGLGSIRRSLLGGIGMGSVSDYCVQHLPCPVLVVKQGPEAEKQQQQT